MISAVLIIEWKLFLSSSRYFIFTLLFALLLFVYPLLQAPRAFLAISTPTFKLL